MTGDTISRSHLLAEIAELKKSPWFNSDWNFAFLVRKEAVEFIEDLCIKKEPAVEPARISGHWIDHKDERGEKYHKCSECGWDHALVIPRNYCPRCGADMRGGDG